MKEVKKVWGKEIWVVNCKDYCGKLLHLDKGAESSTHYHIKKKETFFCLKGHVTLTIKGKTYRLTPACIPRTIKPGQAHGFLGIEDSVILEISTHHDEKDVVRLTESKGVRN